MKIHAIVTIINPNNKPLKYLIKYTNGLFLNSYLYTTYGSIIPAEQNLAIIVAANIPHNPTCFAKIIDNPILRITAMIGDKIDSLNVSVAGSIVMYYIKGEK